MGSEDSRIYYIGEHINVEIQVANQKHYRSRSLYYWARVYGTQLDSREDYAILRRTICINLLDFIHFKDTDKLHNVFSIQKKETRAVLTDHLEIHFIELPKFKCNEEGNY